MITKEQQKQHFLNFCDEHKIFDAIGTLCLIGCGDPYIAKLVGINCDQYDYYYVLLSHQRGLVFDTCVDRCESLKGKLEDHDYQLRRFDEHLTLNPHHKNEDAIYGYDFEALKERFKDQGIYTSREDLINNYVEIKSSDNE